MKTNQNQFIPASLHLSQCCRLSWLAALVLLALTRADALAATSGESFDYPDGSAVGGQSGGSGWTGAWTAQTGNGTIVTANGSLSYPGLVSTGGRFYCAWDNPPAGTTTTTYRTTDAPLTGGTHYIRLLAQNLSGGRRYFGLALFNASTERMLLGQGSGFTNWTINHVNGITNAAYTNILVSPFNSTTAALLLLKLELRDGPERVTLWVNPDLSRAEDVSTAVGGQSYLTDNDFGTITRVRAGGGGYSATAGGNPTDHYLDEISISPLSPFPPKLACAAADGILTLSWPTENLGWILQMQPNEPGAGLGGPWVDVPDTGLVTSTNLFIEPAYPSMFFRLRSP